MSGSVYIPQPHRRLALPQQSRNTGSILILLMIALLALVMGKELSGITPPPAALLIGGGIVGLCMLALTLTHYEFVVGLGVILLGVVKVQPAPVDLIFGLCIVVAIATGRINLRNIPLAPAAALALFIAMNLISMVDVIAPGAALYFFALTLYGALIVVWLSGYIDSERRARQVVICYLIAAGTSAALGILAIFAPIPLAADFVYGGDRIQALFKDPNVFAPFLIPVALIVLEESVNPRLLRFPRWIKLSLFVMLSVAVLLSGSRAAWASLAIGVVVMLAVMSLRQGGGRRAGAILAALIIGVGATAAIVTLSGSDSLLQKRATVQAYDKARFAAQDEGIHLAESHPAGLGPGQFDSYSPVAIHSLYLRALAEQGIVGFVALVGFMLATLTVAIRSAVLGRDTMGIGSAALLGAWIGLIVNSIVIDSMHWRSLWVLAAMIWAGAMHSRFAGGHTDDDQLLDPT